MSPVTQKREARRFALILAGVLVLLALLAWWKGHDRRALACGGAAALAPALAYLVSSLWIRFFRVWMKFGELLGWVMTRVILTMFYFLLLTPYGLVARLFRKDPLDLDWKRRRPGYWIDRPSAAPEPKHYERQY